MTIQIEKNVPMPESRGPRGYGAYREVMKKLEVGDSFIAEGSKMTTLQSAIRQAAKRANINITVRREGEEGCKIRVWRTPDVEAK
jgi:hypothetical protein